MLQCVRNKLKTADEKLRSIGKHQSATVVQTQNFTFYKSPPIREEERRQLKQREHPESEAAVKPSETSSKESNVMASRIINRGLRERNSIRGADEMERSEMKRRSRSEGPNRRIRQSMDEREGVKKQTFDGGGIQRRELDSPDSDDSAGNGRPAAFESDSDDDREKWTKNPLMVRRMKRSDKKDADKRFSGVDKSFKNIEPFFQDPNGSGGSIGGSNSSSRESGKGNSKYQKLEEMRQRRLNLSVTSDEETTPASRISRLRQRAIQSGLGEQTQSSLHPVRPIDASQYDNVRILRHQNPVISDFKDQRPSADNLRTNPPARPLATPGITPLNRLSINESKTFSQPAHNQKPVLSSNYQSQPQIDQTRVYQQQSGLAQRHSFIQPNPKQAPARPPPPNVSGTRQPVHTSQDSTTLRSLYNSSPEVTVRKFTTQVRIPSADSILDSVNIKDTNRNVPYPQTAGTAQVTQKSQFNEVVEMRLKNFREDKMRALQKPSKSELVKSDRYGLSEDSLDELIESNIQYLDSEIDKEKAKRISQVNVSRSSSLPDPRRLTSNSSSSVTNLKEPRSFQVQANTSIQFEVSLPHDSRHSNMSGPPLIKIAPTNSIDYNRSDSQYRSQPDVVPRKYSYDSHAKTSRPSSEYFDRDDLSKSDSQLNAPVIMPSYLGNNLHPNHARGCVSDMNLRSDLNTLQVPMNDKGMFSDVEYDIEVSERVKKWETFMKVQDNPLSNEKKSLNLTTIQENNENEALMLPSEVRKSVLLNKQGEFGLYPKEANFSQLAKPRNFSSDTSINRSSDSPKLFSVETNAHRFFQVIQDPQAGPKIGAQSQSVSSIIRAPITINTEKGFMSAKELHQYMLSHRQNVQPVSSGPVIATSQAVIHYAPGYDFSSSQDESTPQVKRSPILNTTRDPLKRMSRYQNEIDEINNVKSDSVNNLRKRFDNDSATMTSEDDQKSVSTVSARLSRPSRISPSQNSGELVDWTKVIPGFQSKIKESDVWSPNLESTQGVPVSIERVTARTLQTIPFSEDPFWKEIEEMTTFDPSTMAGHLSTGNSQDKSRVLEQVKSQYQVELIPPHSCTLPNQPRSNLLSTKDRMHRSKSLYTPNIAPLTINVDKMSTTVSALDDVLDDINRSSIERKQLSPKKRAFETEFGLPKTGSASNYTNDISQPVSKVGGASQLNYVKPHGDIHLPTSKAFEFNSLSQIKAEPVSLVSKQPLQFYQQQRQQLNNGSQQMQQSQQIQQSQVLLGANSNNYQLDPDLLKQKLLSTGLVVDTDTEDNCPLLSSGSDLVNSPFSGGVQNYSSIIHQSTEPVKSFITPTYVSKQIEPQPQVKSYTPKGSSALDEIQKALEPFSTSYQPGPESLYGTAILESFKSSGLDTTRGPQTKSTGWSYQLPTAENRTPLDSLSTNTSSDTLQKVNESMDDLKDLAQTVERKINILKTKLQSADERSLDNILGSLKRLTPEVKTGDDEFSSFEDYYTTKKSKLSDALSELDRIYKSLEIRHDEMATVTERGKYKQYRPSKSSDFILAPQPKSEHLKPMQTRISSFYIPGLENKNKQLDKETESEFDLLSKSFQAIVDEVNQTTDMFSQNISENTAPETQKQTFKITLKSGDTSQPSMTSNDGSNDTFSEPSTGSSNKTQNTKTKYSRFRSKIQDSKDSDQNVKTTRSKSVPEIQSSASDGVNIETANVTNNGNNVMTSTLANNPASTTNTNVNTSTTQAISKQPRNRVRPVKDNKIIQDDKAIRRGSNEKILPSPQPSPKVTRKIIYNNGVDLDKKPNSSTSFQESPSEGDILIIPQDQMVKSKTITQLQETNSPVSLTILSPSTQKKIPPPTAAKPINRPESLIPTSVKSTVKAPTKQELQKVNVKLKLSTNKSLPTDSSSSSGVTVSSSAASTASISLTPPVFDGTQSKFTPTQNVDPESSSGGQRSKRKLGTGVALMLDRFNVSEEGADPLKKRGGTRSAPDLCTSEEGNEKVEEEKSRAQNVDKSEDVKSILQVKLSNNRSTEKTTSRVSDKPLLIKSTTASSLERKLTDPEGKVQSSGASSPSSPSSKPPLHPWKRLMSDPDKPTDSSTDGFGSPKIISKMTKMVNAGGCASPKPSDASSSQVSTSPVLVTRRVRPTDRKIQTESTNNRPHSFHELMSYFEKDQNRHKRQDKLRKCLSADAVYMEVLVDKMFQSEPDLSLGRSEQSDVKKNVVLKFEMKVIS